MSFEMAAITIGIICFTCSALVSKIRVKWVELVLIVVIPFVIASSFYWFPVLFLGRSDDQYSTWSSLFVTLWGIIGVICMFLGYLLFNRDRKHVGKG